jgi:hypothetical protein
MALDWNWLLHADELLLFIYLIVWAIREIIGVTRRPPTTTP